ncbi:hypothetical protein [Cohnella lupini]|uniref:Uncharacterized protein n=1 Tax=Cohnella lupini TaxID=1294267 RepID=A0A3D9I0N8_9BACL|nr:hypothetical protein [Cohnella lupini]RED55304.1 hypothetical protein DFP95_11839 [Cohnella lupini]
MRTNLRKYTLSLLLIVCLAVFTTGCIPVPSGTVPFTDIGVTKTNLIVQNRSGDVRYDVKITVDDKYNYVVDVLSLGRSSFPLSEFVDDQGNRYAPGFLKVRNVTVYIADENEGTEYYRW